MDCKPCPTKPSVLPSKYISCVNTYVNIIQNTVK